MKKKTYIKPTVQVIVLRHQAMLLQASQNKQRSAPEDALDYDDFFG